VQNESKIKIVITGPLMFEPCRLDAPDRKQNHQLHQQDIASAEIQVQIYLQSVQSPIGKSYKSMKLMVKIVGCREKV
jgi:hypothetical protein